MDIKRINEFAESKRNSFILYVEDDESIAEQTLDFLNELFSNVLYANNGQDGYEICKNQHIDLIITDMSMPKMNGIEMLKKIKSSNIEVPSILLTALNVDIHVNTPKELNIKAQLQKPICLENFFTILWDFFEK